MGLLELRSIEKRFGGVAALRRGSLSVASGEVHLLMGENGAGKSTLMKIAAGLTQPEGGEFLWRGEPQRFRRPADAAAVGIAMVHQESLLAPHLTVAENLFLGREECAPFGWLKRRKMMDRAARLIEEHHFPIQADARVDKLSPAGRQLVEICRALVQGSSLLIFDEPTSSLSDAETREVFRLVKSLRDRGMGVIYITHRLEELREVGDRVTVLRDGETVHTGDLKDLTIDQLIRHMVGREMADRYPKRTPNIGPKVFEVKNWKVHHDIHPERVVIKGVDLHVNRGEILGIAGLMGAGRTELAMSIFGRTYGQGISGEVFLNGKPIDTSTVQKAINHGIAYVTEDRKGYGLVLEETIAWNTTLANLRAVSTNGVIDEGREFGVAEDYRRKLNIRSPDVFARTVNLSGGNQQKVVLSKWLFSDPQVLILDEPTRGIDVGAKYEIYTIIAQLAAEGKCVIMISSEMPELLGMCDRICVLNEGTFVAEFSAAEATQEKIMRSIVTSGVN